MEFSVNVENNMKILAKNFSPLFLLHCYCQVAANFTFNSHYFVKLPFWNAFVNPKRKNYMWNVWYPVPKLQKTILYVTRRDVQLEHCIVPNVPISPQNPKITWITIMLRSTAPRNLMSLSSVNFVIKIFQDFKLYVTLDETLTTECRSDQEQEMLLWNT